ncbi:MAG: hypothetical protein OHK0023_09000 [Anaerolineae bacterium]
MSFSPKASWRVAILILIAAAALRLQNLSAIEHNVDHAYPIWQALTTLERGNFPILGQGTSVLFANPALTGYLYILPLVISRSPFAVYLFVIALNLLGVWLAYLGMRHLWREPAALIGMFLMAVNPWLVEYSRTSWVQALLPFFVPLVFWLFVPIWLGIAPKPRRRFLLGCVALAGLTQTYLLAFLTLLPVAILSLIYRKQIGTRTFLIGAILFALPTSLYGLGLLSESAQTLSRIQTFSQGEAKLSLEALDHALRLVTGREYAAARGLAAPIEDSLLRFNVSEIAHLALLMAMFGGLAILLASGEKRVALVITAAWFGIPIIAMSYVSQQVHPFYLLLTLPIGHCVAGIGLGELWCKLHKTRLDTLRWLGVLLLLALGVLGALNAIRYAEESLITPGIDGLTALPVGEGVAMAQQLIQQQLPPEGVVVADVDEWILNSFVGRLFPVERDTDTRRTLYFPSAGGLYLYFDKAGMTPNFPLPDAESRQYIFADGSAVTTFVVPNTPPTFQIPFNAPTDRGLMLIGATQTGDLAAGSTLSLQLAFRVNELPADRANWLLSPFVHVYDATNRRVLIVDGSATPGWTWRLGDIHLKMMHFQIPNDAAMPLRFVVGLYDGVNQSGAIFTLTDGSQDSVVPLPEP